MRMGRNPSKEDTREFLEYLRSGRDQMDLLECSVSGADKKPDFDTRSLSFARQCKHPQTGEPVDRSWLDRPDGPSSPATTLARQPSGPPP